MKKLILFAGFLFLFASVFLSVSCTAESAELFNLFLTGETDYPIGVVISSPQYDQLAQFGSERIESLNRLIKHLSFDVSVDGDCSETVFFIDQESFLTVTDQKTGNAEKRTYSFDKNHKYEFCEGEIKQEEDFLTFLDTWFFRINSFLDNLYPVFDKAAESFHDLASSSVANLSFSGFGRGVRRIIIQFPSEYVKEHFPSSLCSLCDDDSLSEFVQSFVFQGSQKIILLYDKDDHLIRINYDGILGLSYDSLRRVSIVWKCLRNADHIKDSITVKTPEVHGNDRDNITYERDYDLTEPGNQTFFWDIQMDHKEDQDKRKTRYSAELICGSDALEGLITYNDKKDNTDISISIKPTIKKEKNEEYSGTLEITHKTGKIVISSIHSHISFHYCAGLHNPHDDTDTEEQIQGCAAESGADEMKAALVKVLLQRLVQLPAEDLDFLNKDMPQDAWTSLINSLL